MKIQEYGFELKGIMPLLMHQDDIEQSDSLAAWRKAPDNKNQSVAGDDRSPAWTWQTYVYTDGEHITMPSQNIAVCLRQAGAQMTLKGRKTFKDLTQSGMLIKGEYCQFFVNGKQVPLEALDSVREKPFEAQAELARELGFRLFVKRARINQSKHVRVRPRFDNWLVRGTVCVFAPEITRDILSQLFDLAGRVGLGDWRPGCKNSGPYGMFSAKLI